MVGRLRKDWGRRVSDPHPSDALALRATVLQILGGASVAMGLTMALTQPASGLAWFTHLHGWPWVYGGALVLAGAAIVIGSWWRQPIVTMCGVYVAIVWFFGFSAGFLIQWAVWHLGDRIGPEPAVYPFWPYLGVAVVLGAHLDVLRHARHVQRLLR